MPKRAVTFSKRCRTRGNISGQLAKCGPDSAPIAPPIQLPLAFPEGLVHRRESRGCCERASGGGGGEIRNFPVRTRRSKKADKFAGGGTPPRDEKDCAFRPRRSLTCSFIHLPLATLQRRPFAVFCGHRAHSGRFTLCSVVQRPYYEVSSSWQRSGRGAGPR